MPTYEYQCEKCNLQFEEYQSIKAEPLKKCKNEQCDGTVKRLFSAGAGFLFKGSGFYITDYRSDSYKKAATSEGTSGASPSTTAPSASTSKPTTQASTTSTPAAKNSTTSS